MIQCINCGQFNNAGSNFCRSCGTRMVQAQSSPQSYENNPPRPYSWKTDEFQGSESAAKRTGRINQVQPLLNRQSQAPKFSPPNQNPAMLTMNQRYPQMAYGYRCPNCGTQNFPYIERKISTAGWVTFAVLLAVFLPLCWIGLLIKEEVRVCPVCNVRLSS